MSIPDLESGLGHLGSMLGDFRPTVFLGEVGERPRNIPTLYLGRNYIGHSSYSESFLYAHFFRTDRHLLMWLSCKEFWNVRVGDRVNLDFVTADHIGYHGIAETKIKNVARSW